MENFVYKILSTRRNKFIVIMLVLIAMGASVMMIPSKLVLARMLPGKSANTFTIYVDTATNASVKETKSVTSCVVNFMTSEKEVTDMEVFFRTGSTFGLCRSCQRFCDEDAKESG